MNLKRWWKQVVAHWLALAELDVRLSQRTFDGSDRARRRYQRAIEQLKKAEAEALLIIAPSDDQSVSGSANEEASTGL